MGVYKDYVYQPWPYQLPAVKNESSSESLFPLPQFVKQFYRMMTTTSVYTEIHSNHTPHCPYCSIMLDLTVAADQAFHICPSCRYTEIP